MIRQRRRNLDTKRERECFKEFGKGKPYGS